MTEARSRWIGPLLLLGTGVGMFAWTRGAWPDPLVDFGRELYVPWRLSEGEALYTDVAWFNGPLSQHWNAAWFRVFGTGLSTLVWSNALILAASVALLYGGLVRLSDRLSAVVAGLVFLLVFAFGQYVGIANFNWITPYSHELTHGIFLALAAWSVGGVWLRSRSWRAAALTGIVLGLCFLTKVETFLAGSAAVVFLAIPMIRDRDVRGLGALAAGAALPVLASLALVGWAGTLGAWPSVLSSEVAALPFYRVGMGLDQPARRLLEAGGWLSLWVLAVGPIVAAGWLGRESRGPLLPAACAVVVLATLLLLGDRILWIRALRPLPFAVVAVGAGWLLWPPKETDADARWSALGISALSLVLLGKMLLAARVGHYGFALAMPGTLLVVTALVGWLPGWLTKSGGRGDVLRAGAVALLVVFCVSHVRTTRSWVDRKTEVVDSGQDAFRSDPRGAFVNLAVDYLEASGASSAAVLPEGVIINYLARIPNPTPYVNFMPPEEILFGGSEWARAFRETPPDVILFVPKNTAEYGRGFFGDGYGTELMRWVNSAYARDGELRIEGESFAIQILVRR